MKVETPAVTPAVQDWDGEATMEAAENRARKQQSFSLHRVRDQVLIGEYELCINEAEVGQLGLCVAAHHLTRDALVPLLQQRGEVERVSILEGRLDILENLVWSLIAVAVSRVDVLFRDQVCYEALTRKQCDHHDLFLNQICSGRHLPRERVIGKSKSDLQNKPDTIFQINL